MIEELNALSQAGQEICAVVEENFKEIKFPLKNDVWSKNEVMKFFEDTSNIHRTIFCKEVNVDEIDDWGMFGYEPDFIFIEKKNYEGARTLADQASLFGLSIARDPKTGLGLMNHFDYFPRHKFEYRVIKRSHDRELFDLLCEIFTKKHLGETKKQ